MEVENTDESPEPLFSETLELDMSTVEPSLAGPKRPQDRIPLDKLEESFHKAMEETFRREKKNVEADHEYHRWLWEGGNFSDEHKRIGEMHVEEKYEMKVPIKSGSIVIAAITSCTNTSNPTVMIGAGLLAKKAVERGLKIKPYVKTSLAPGSLVVTEYLKKSGLMPYLEALGFHLVGYGCTTCIGNSGLIQDKVAKAVKEKNLTVAAVLSGNRNFEGRINPLVKANYLVSPVLVVAYAISGTVDIDLKTEPIGFDPNNNPVYLKDIWPDSEDIRQTIKNTIDPMLYEKQYSEISHGSKLWEELIVPTGKLYKWDAAMLYKQKQTPLIIIAGKEYGTGSSRDWATKGTYLLGVVAVIAESFERIHRSNLLGMGVLPLQFEKGENADTLGLKGDEVFDILDIRNIFTGEELHVVAKADGKETKFKVLSRLDATIEVEFYRNGGILHTFLRNILKK